MILEEIPITEVPIYGVFIAEDAEGNYHIGKRAPRPRIFQEGLISCRFYLPWEGVEDANEWDFGWLSVYHTVAYTGVKIP